MAARSISTLSLTFGLVSIPIRLYSATESAAAIKFKLFAPGGAKVRQSYVTDELPSTAQQEPTESPEPQARSTPVRAAKASRNVDTTVVALPTARVELSPAAELPAPELGSTVSRLEMVKGFEFEKGQFVLFTPAELKALEEESRQTIDIVSFIPNGSVDPIYFDKPYFLAPDKRGGKPYSLLLSAMQATGRCALAKWAWRSKEYVVQVRATDGGLVLQQLLYADEVRTIDALNIELVPVSDAELELAKQIIQQISAETYDPTEFVDEEKQRILAAVERKVEGNEIITHDQVTHAVASGADVLDLMTALRASLARQGKTNHLADSKVRKPAKRSAAPEPKSKAKRSA